MNEPHICWFNVHLIICQFVPIISMHVHKIVASSPGSPIFVNVHKGQRGSLGSNVTWQMLTWRHEREAVNNRRFRIGPPTSVYQTQLFVAFTTLAWRLWHHIFHPHWTGPLENMVHPHTTFMIRHPSYTYIWGLRHSHDVGFQAPPFSLVYVEKDWGAWGQSYTNSM